MKTSKQVAEHYIWGDGCDGWHLVRQPELSVIHERMPAGTAEIKHYHERSRQYFFALSGVLTIEIEGKSVTLQPQEGVEIPPGVAHQARNEHAHAVEFLVISHPTTRGDRVEVTSVTPARSELELR
ncbi:cupin domain-containing protein [Brevibacillus migulae]|uniref:cupin domain-containing protein n=1 Tax=Brevibacillus migulae TaxID=1644114 RepID=UPI00106ECA2E|nr:cupin domain-containing protein [Brevibacillus migulae]